MHSPFRADASETATYGSWRQPDRCRGRQAAHLSLEGTRDGSTCAPYRFVGGDRIRARVPSRPAEGVRLFCVCGRSRQLKTFSGSDSRRARPAVMPDARYRPCRACPGSNHQPGTQAAPAGVPIVFVKAHGDGAIRPRLLSAGAVNYLLEAFQRCSAAQGPLCTLPKPARHCPTLPPDTPIVFSSSTTSRFTDPLDLVVRWAS